jgi:hypothetical protein
MHPDTEFDGDGCAVKELTDRADAGCPTCRILRQGVDASKDLAPANASFGYVYVLRQSGKVTLGFHIPGNRVEFEYCPVLPSGEYSHVKQSGP